MKAGRKVTLYGAGLAVAFGGAFGLANVIVPDSAVAAWTQGGGEMGGQGGHDMAAMTSPSSGTSGSAEPISVKGVSLNTGDLVLASVAAPSVVGEAGTLSYRIEDAGGKALTTFTTTHEKDMHLIVVRSDGGNFRHVHPALDASTGTWSIPWTWTESGTYRVYTDFKAGSGTAATLSSTVEVAGDYRPTAPKPVRVSVVDGYTVTLEGDLTSGSSSGLKLTVTQEGKPVTALKPYLGAFGHLVALRQGDMAFLHVHPEGDEPVADASGGPTIAFAAEVPTAGRYLLYLDFKVDDQVHTASFVVDASQGSVPVGESAPAATDTEHSKH